MGSVLVYGHGHLASIATPAQRWEDKLGLYDYTAPYYDPTTTRFLSADTLVPDPSNPQSFNRYTYVLNNPLRFTDPTGHISCTNSNLPGDDQQDCLDTQPPSPPILPSQPPVGLNTEYGQLAWDGLQTIQQMNGGWWGTELDAQEAIMLVLNHELGTELGRNAHSAPRDVLINQYNAYCSKGVWSADCLNKFWGYSHVIRESRVALNGGARFKRPEYITWLEETSAGFINRTIQPVDSSLMHYGNAFDDYTANRLYQDYQNGVTTYASYVSISDFEMDYTLNVMIIHSVFVVQTYEQWSRTGTLQNWIYSE